MAQQAHVVGLLFRCAPNQPQMRALCRLWVASRHSRRGAPSLQRAPKQTPTVGPLKTAIDPNRKLSRVPKSVWLSPRRTEKDVSSRTAFLILGLSRPRHLDRSLSPTSSNRSRLDAELDLRLQVSPRDPDGSPVSTGRLSRGIVNLSARNLYTISAWAKVVESGPPCPGSLSEMMAAALSVCEPGCTRWRQWTQGEHQGLMSALREALWRLADPGCRNLQ
jgi:hypothetical protein